MPLTPEAGHALYADETGVPLEVQLEAALARNIAGGLAVAEMTSLSSVASGLLAEADDSTLLTINSEGLSVDFADTLTDMFTHEGVLFSKIGLEVPSPLAFTEAGVDFARLSKAWGAMLELDMQPELVIAPVLPIKEWKAVFQALQDDPYINHDDGIRNGGLKIAHEVAGSWDGLQNHGNSVQIKGNRWDVCVMTGTDQPPLNQINHFGKDYRSDIYFSDELTSSARAMGLDVSNLSSHMIHPTISAYLTLQANRFFANSYLGSATPPVDNAESNTWLHGTTTDRTQAPRACWYGGDGQVRVILSRVTLKREYIGVRLPVWGST